MVGCDVGQLRRNCGVSWEAGRDLWGGTVFAQHGCLLLPGSLTEPLGLACLQPLGVVCTGSLLGLQKLCGLSKGVHLCLGVSHTCVCFVLISASSPATCKVVC